MSIPFSHRAADRRVFTGRTNMGSEVELRPGGPLVIALHGGTYSSKYFDIPGHSLLDNASPLGVPVIALDRPNYGGSSPLTTSESIIFANAEIIGAAVEAIWEEHRAGASGVVLIGHSIGAAVAMVIAATAQSWPLLGLATSGCLVRVPPESAGAWAALPDTVLIDLPVPFKDQLMFGPSSTYDDTMPAASYPSNTPVPKAELLDITGGWVERRAEVCGRVAIPVHHRQGEFDRLWLTSQDEMDEFAKGFTAAPSVDSELQRGSGHCIDFHLPGAAFQRSQLEFALTMAKRVI